MIIFGSLLTTYKVKQHFFRHDKLVHVSNQTVKLSLSISHIHFVYLPCLQLDSPERHSEQSWFKERQFRKRRHADEDGM